MVKHVVMWKLKDFAEGADKAENARKLKQKLEALQDVIDDLRFAEAGINFNDSDAAFDVILYSKFENRAALSAYQQHPAHQQLISDFLDKIRSEKRVVDYEV